MQRPRRKITPNFAGGCPQLTEDPCDCRKFFCPPNSSLPSASSPGGPLSFPGAAGWRHHAGATTIGNKLRSPQAPPQPNTSAHYRAVGEVPKHRKAAPAPAPASPADMRGIPAHSMEKGHKRGPLLYLRQYFYTSRWFLPSQVCS